MLIGVLGPLRLEGDDGRVCDIRERKVRLLLMALVEQRDGVASVDSLVERVWAGDAPANPSRTLRAKVSLLRTVLDDARPGARDMVVTTDGGYRFDPGRDVVDADRFVALSARARAIADPAGRAAALGEALTLWRGGPYADAADELWLAPAIAELTERRLVAVEERVAALLDAGVAQDALDEAAPLATEHPGRERLAAVVMGALYALGRQDEALARFDALRRRLADDLGTDPGPALRQLHERILRHDGDLAPAGRARSNLPAELSPLIGRADETSEVAELLDTTRLVTLTGPGGVGKTRLALHVARSRTDRHPRGTWFADLTALDTEPLAHDGERVAELVATAMDLPDPPRGRADQLATASDGALLVLDNAEHVVGEVAAFVADLLVRAGGVRMLVTSREALAVPAEQRVALTGMPRDSAVALFVARARAARGDVVADEATTDSIAELARRLDGLPLALELAAGRLGVLSVEELLERVSDRLNLLSRPGRGVPRRQQTLRGMLDWSWSLLDEPARTLLRRLAVPRGGFALDTAEACGGEIGGGVLDVLDGLVERSLVVATEADGAVRFGLLEAVSSYAAEQLDAAGERDATTLRHADHCLALAWRLDGELRGPGQRRAVRRFDLERTALLQAREEAVRRADADRALGLALATWWHRWITGRVVMLRNELAAALAVPGGDDDVRARAQLLRVTLTLDDDPDRAVARAEEAVADAAVLEDVDRARLQWMLGSGLIGVRGVEDRHRETGGRLLAAAVAIFEQAGDRWHRAVAVAQWELWASLYDTPAAPPRSAPRPLETFEALEDGWGVLLALGVEHQHARLAGDSAASRALATRALDRARDLHLWGEVAQWTATVALVALDDGDDERADALIAEARALAGEVVYDYVVFAEYVASVAARCRGDLAAARAGLDLWFTHGTPADDVFALLEHGVLALREGDPERARAAHDAVVGTGQLSGAAAARCDELGAGVAALQGDDALARRRLDAAAARRSAAGQVPTRIERAERDVVEELIAALPGY